MGSLGKTNRYTKNSVPFDDSYFNMLWEICYGLVICGPSKDGYKSTSVELEDTLIQLSLLLIAVGSFSFWNLDSSNTMR